MVGGDAAVRYLHFAAKAKGAEGCGVDNQCVELHNMLVEVFVVDNVVTFFVTTDISNRHPVL
jgi:hypothetical protein